MQHENKKNKIDFKLQWFNVKKMSFIFRLSQLKIYHFVKGSPQIDWLLDGSRW